jgi:hypothetical protein
MISVAIVICLLIIAGLIAVLAFKKDGKNDDYRALLAAHASLPGPQGPPGQGSCAPVNSACNVEEDYPWRWRGWGWRRHPGWYRRGVWADPYAYYPQSLVTETCLNECCDYDKCAAGLGCNWKGLDNRWHLGHPTQCLAYRNCVNSSTKPDKERHLECAAKAAQV